MKRKWLENKIILGLLGALGLLALFILACGDDATPAPTAAPPPAATIDVAAITSGLQRTIQEEVGKIQPPLSEAEIRGLIEGAISTSMPDSVSAEEIQSMVDSAVMAAAAEGVTQADVTAAIGEALVAAMAAAPEPLTASEIEQIVKASIPTPAPVAMMTATPTAMAPTAMAPKVPVSPRLRVTKVPPGAQVTMMWKTFTSETGPMKPMYEFIINTNRTNGEYESTMLASEWTMSPDAQSWTLNLREGIPFHSTDSYTGTNFSAKDFKLTLQTAGREDSLSAGSQWRNLGIQDMNFEIVNDHEVIWHLDRVEPLGEGWLAEGNVAGIISQDYWDAVGEEGYLDHPVGNRLLQVC